MTNSGCVQNSARHAHHSSSDATTELLTLPDALTVDSTAEQIAPQALILYNTTQQGTKR